ncbi:hypothetical protein [Burkholderia ubonensis]|uniref:hypothetical protein n=1 Tax=Burkholderia ubonensis TaxID=101571 RepID=UPI0012F7D0B7|nr:hypothetical protein [Burkholderia ubonensis]
MGIEQRYAITADNHFSPSPLPNMPRADRRLDLAASSMHLCFLIVAMQISCKGVTGQCQQHC